MCFASKPKIIKPPAPVLAPLMKNKTVDVKRGADDRVGGKKGRRRGTGRTSLVVNRPEQSPAGINPGAKGTGVYG
tara:strand:- start:48 stop:272 length:225 start_codon:yes stop_codon:yes gene_type:complete